MAVESVVWRQEGQADASLQEDEDNPALTGIGLED